jgi:3-phosphoshikimate 1-carboxyvinyltransferase
MTSTSSTPRHWPDPWPAPQPTGPLRATVRIPGSKSVTNRALVLAALAEGTSTLRSPLASRDTLLMAGALGALGAPVDTARGEAWTVRGTGGPLRPAEVPARLDVGNAGTVARFLPAVAALAEGDVVLDGDPRVRERPVGPLLGALRALGADVDDGGRGALPVTVRGTGLLAGGEVTLDASSSSQLVSGLLLAAPRTRDGVTVRHRGGPLPSAPHLAMTVAMLRDAGAVVDDREPETWRVEAGPLRALDLDIEPDLSSAAPFLAAPLVAGGSVTVTGWPLRTTQPGAALVGLLERMGARVELVPTDGRTGTLTVTGSGRPPAPIEADLGDCGELTPVVTALAALASGLSELSGVAHLRLHETDRLAALAKELTALGGDVRETETGLAITPRRLHGGLFSTYDDHRLAMAAAVLGLAVDGVDVADVATTGKTLPRFPDLWSAMVSGGPAGDAPTDGDAPTGPEPGTRA